MVSANLPLREQERQREAEPEAQVVREALPPPVLLEPEKQAAALADLPANHPVDIDRFNISVALRRLEQASSIEEIEALSRLVDQIVKSQRDKRNLEYQETPRAQDRRFARNLVYFKLSFAMLMFTSGVVLALMNFAEIGFFILGGAVTLIIETSFKNRE